MSISIGNPHRNNFGFPSFEHLVIWASHLHLTNPACLYEYLKKKSKLDSLKWYETHFTWFTIVKKGF